MATFETMAYFRSLPQTNKKSNTLEDTQAH